MGLGLQTGGGSSGDIVPFVKYDARAGRLFRVDRLQVNGQFESKDVDITREAVFVMDMANIKVGWINYTTQGPIKHLAILGQAPIPPRPADVNAEGKPAFRQGFEVMLALAKNCAGDGAPLRALSSAAGCVIEAIDALHDAFLAAPESAQGMLPAVKIADTVPVKSGQSTNYKPIFEIMSWVPRPASLPVPAAVATATSTVAPRTTPPVTGSTQVSAPVPQPAPVAVSINDFG